MITILKYNTNNGAANASEKNEQSAINKSNMKIKLTF